jgi:hypothetical protein
VRRCNDGHTGSDISLLRSSSSISMTCGGMGGGFRKERDAHLERLRAIGRRFLCEASERAEHNTLSPLVRGSARRRCLHRLSTTFGDGEYDAQTTTPTSLALASKPLRSSSVPHLVARPPLASNSPMSHRSYCARHAQLCIEKSRARAHGIVADRVGIASLGRRRNPYRRDSHLGDLLQLTPGRWSSPSSMQKRLGRTSARSSACLRRA